MRLDLVGNFDSHDLQQFGLSGCIWISHWRTFSKLIGSPGWCTNGFWNKVNNSFLKEVFPISKRSFQFSTSIKSETFFFYFLTSTLKDFLAEAGICFFLIWGINLFIIRKQITILEPVEDSQIVSTSFWILNGINSINIIFFNNVIEHPEFQKFF